nr:MAG TPA: hypothetical protein [Caudoviricetes sp.]
MKDVLLLYDYEFNIYRFFCRDRRVSAWYGTGGT